MADKLDVAGRLAEARTSVDNTQCYVWACHLLGYQNPDLTTHSAQIRDWFSSEDGMDLHVLDADRSALKAVSVAADDALGQQRDQLARLSAAWHGDGATLAQDFVRRHCDAAEQLASSVRAAADALAGLRDTLWQIIDTKAAAVIAIDDRRQGERSAWLAAAQTVTTGAGDRASASELVDQQVKPFVDKDIRGDWLTAVRTAIAAIGSSYDAATNAIASAPTAQFDVPGDFGPEPAPRDDDGPPARDPAPTAAAAGPAMPSAPAAPASPPPVSAANPPAAAPIPAATALPSAPAGAPAMPASLGQLDGLPQRFADALAGLTSPVEDLVADSPDTSDQPDEPTDEPDHEPTDDETDRGAGEHARVRNPAPSTGVDGADKPAPPPAEPPPPPPVEPPPAPPPPPPPADDGATPCEIAADALPQAGQ